MSSFKVAEAMLCACHIVLSEFPGSAFRGLEMAGGRKRTGCEAQYVFDTYIRNIMEIRSFIMFRLLATPLTWVAAVLIVRCARGYRTASQQYAR
jgi:hypothetical protein